MFNGIIQEDTVNSHDVHWGGFKGAALLLDPKNIKKTSKGLSVRFERSFTQFLETDARSK